MTNLTAYYKNFLKDGEYEILLCDLQELSGYDFHCYARESLIRRVNRIYGLGCFNTFSEFREKIRTDQTYISNFIDRITVNVTEMFRDPEFFKTLSQLVMPTLARQFEIRIWHAGCSSGEEAFSTAILFEEAGLLHKCEILATDINSRVLERAKQGILPSSLIPRYAANYHKAGGIRDLRDYFTTCPQGEKIQDRFMDRINFSLQNLSSPGVDGKFDLIFCRNVLIYFDRKLQNTLLEFFYQKIRVGGILGLGEKETVQLSIVAPLFDQLNNQKLWKKLI
jgi:chemotaxis protein methyltransferase CheR